MKTEKESFAVKRHNVHLDAAYIEWITDLKNRYRTAQVKAAVKVNSEQLLFYWQLGRDLVSRRAEEKWGKGVVEQVSLDLQAAFPGEKGFSTSNLWYMKKWYQFYANGSEDENVQQFFGELFLKPQNLQQIGTSMTDEKLQQAVGELSFPVLFSYIPWGHHILVITRCKTIEEAAFYLKLTVDKNLSRNGLDDYIRSDLYHKSGGAITNFHDRLSAPQNKLAQEILKGNYDLRFISLQEDYADKDLEDAIEKHITRFLLELGNGWAFVGRQKEIVIAGTTRRIDLLFYHIYLRCYVVIELKVKPFEPEFAGKLNFYVNAVDQFIRRESDNNTIGLLICKDLKRTEVQLAFQGITTPMGVATYDNVRIREIQAHLPTAEQLQQCIELGEEEFRKKQKKNQNDD